MFQSHGSYDFPHKESSHKKQRDNASGNTLVLIVLVRCHVLYCHHETSCSGLIMTH